MYQAARGSTGVEFKIGCRPYAQGRLSLPDGAGHIEAGREFSIVDLDRFAAKYFSKFAAELLDKRVINATGSGSLRRGAFIPGYTPRDEADRYVKKARDAGARHLATFREKWLRYELTAESISTVIASVFDEEASGLVDMLTAMAMTRWLDRGGGELPDWVPKRRRPQTREQSLVRFGTTLRSALVQRYERGSAVSRAAGAALRAADDEVSTWEQAALFQIAAAFKNQRKYHTGFEPLVRISSNVALVFIQIMKSAWDLQALNGGNPRETIRPEVQSEAVYAVSESWFGRIEHEYEHGILQASFLRSLGAALRAIQMDPAATIPAPNGFSVAPHSAQSEAEDAGPERTPAEDATTFLHTLVSWGLLEPTEHQDKTRGRPRRTKYYLNRILCPYLGLTEVRTKDPLYIENIDTFIALLRAGKVPGELRRARGNAARTAEQPRLV